MILKFKAVYAKKVFSLFLVFGLVLATFSFSAAADGKAEQGTDYPFVFVAGYAGWGQYDKINESFQYWGMRSGDLIGYLNTQGFECVAASVDPVGSAWDRACELYAQLTGGVVDYGEAHAAQHNHKRFGTDYSKSPLVNSWDDVNKVNFICHSFGGATVRLLAQLLATGSQAERNASGSGVSALFAGGKPDLIHSITTLASPHNGTTVVNLTTPIKPLLPSGNTKIVGSPISVNFAVFNYLKNMSKLLNNGIGEDTGAYDLSLDGAAQLNETLTVSDKTYYFSYPTDATAPVPLFNKRIPDMKLTDAVFLPTCLYMGMVTGVTPGGIIFDKSWHSSDGIVNTISSKAPANEAQKAFDASGITPGVWHIMDTFRGDHASIVGGVIRAVDVKPFYVEHLTLVNSL